MKRIIALAASALMLVALVAVGLAHAEIKSCTPPVSGSVDKAPDKLVCKTSEGMDPKGSELSVFDARGTQVDKKDSAVDLNDPDRVTIAVSLDAANMPNGVYTVKWKTLSAADGDAAEGEFNFGVVVAVQASTTQATAAPTNPAPTAAPTTTATTVAATIAAPTNASTTAPATATPTPSLPVTGGDMNLVSYEWLALLGFVILGAGIVVAVRVRR